MIMTMIPFLVAGICHQEVPTRSVPEIGTDKGFAGSRSPLGRYVGIVP